MISTETQLLTPTTQLLRPTARSSRCILPQEVQQDKGQYCWKVCQHSKGLINVP
jgi:hypothetical protein